ncbi:MAG: ATP-binding protein [Candidatus Izimaplasma sp.]|nr:ATP-binding protein [Candidatus Izimaplasma bacterium]
MINEIVVISGKGGTGKTSITASIIPYFEDLVIADCDVDAPDLNILIQGDIIEERDFIGIQRPIIDYDKCTHCGLCHNHCKFNAISEDIVINTSMCEGCKVCEYVCPVNAITMHDYVIGKIFHRKTIFGPMIDARLIPGEESSGKLVAEVRKLARDVAYQENLNTIIIDGSPGIACNVISAITGVSKAIIVTEPTVSGLHDLKKVVQLIRMFSVEAKVIINKYDLSLSKAKEIKEYLELMNIEVILELPFDIEVVNSISNLQIPSTTAIDFFSSKRWFDFIEYLRN